MGSSSGQPISPEFAAAFRARADPSGYLTFESFMALALYHPTLGYYCRDRERVGRSPSTDFYTASSLGPVFGELVVAVACRQLGPRDPASFTFVELGAEAGRSVLDGVPHPFADLRRVGATDALEVSGDCIVFSNELFDAQPCARFVRDESGWQECGVLLKTDGSLSEVLRPAVDRVPDLTHHLPVGYRLDLPRQATALTARIAAQPWRGLFLAFDYGKSWTELSTACPQGTVRAYHRHQQSNDLLAQPGEQDLTCHICWDWVSDALRENGFAVDPVLSQEAFLVKNAADALARIMQAEASRMTPRKAGLLQLLHPSALGRKFQGITAWREEIENSPCFK